MDGVRAKSESHENGFDAKNLFKGSDDGDTASGTDWDRRASVNFMVGFFRRLVSRQINRADVRRTAVEVFHFYLDIVGSDGFKVFFEEFCDAFVFLVGHEAAADFGMGNGWEDGFGAFAGVAAPDAADIESRADAGAFAGGVALFAVYGTDAERFLVGFEIERSFRHFGTLFGRHLEYVIIESGDGDVSVVVHHAGNHLAQGVDGVGNRSAEDAGMEVGIGTGDFDLPIGETAQSGGDRGDVACNHAGV